MRSEGEGHEVNKKGHATCSVTFYSLRDFVVTDGLLVNDSRLRRVLWSAQIAGNALLIGVEDHDLI